MQVVVGMSVPQVREAFENLVFEEKINNNEIAYKTYAQKGLIHMIIINGLVQFLSITHQLILHAC